MAVLDKLSTELLNIIREVTLDIMSKCIPRIDGIPNPFESLLPLLPQLQHVRLGESWRSCCFCEEWFEPSLLVAINQLQRPVTLSISYRVDTVDSNTRIGQLSCLNMLRLNTHQDSHPDLVSISSRDIAKFILQNPRLRNLSLRLAERSSEGAVSNLHWETLDHALEHVSRSDFQLESLALEGNSHFSKGAWTAWRTNFGWTSLRSLSIANITLAQQMTSHLSGQLPALQTLKLSVFDESDSADLIRISDDTDKFKSASASIKAFISTLHLTGLSLHGFNPDILDHSIESSSVTLRKLRLHVCDSDPSLLFGTEPRENLRSTCKALEWLGLNVTPLSLLGASHISDKPIKIEYIPRGNASAGKVGSHYDPIIADTYLLDTLATILPLRHIRLFIHWPYDDETLPMSNTQAISIFAYLRSHKRGNALESLVICGHEWGTSGVWIIWDLGPWMATLESCKNGQWYEEVWNTEERKLCERRERHVVGPASIKDYFGVPEGW